MELRVYPTLKEAEAAFLAERGVGHYFRQLEVLKIDGTRVKFAAVDGLRGAEWLATYAFDKVEINEGVPEKCRRFLLALVR